MTERVLYEGSNGDVWALRVAAGGPERQQLLKLIDTLLED
ncbi:hypothetical protein ACVIN2_003658 [Bradyrhizobium sp. USDA 3650]